MTTLLRRSLIVTAVAATLGIGAAAIARPQADSRRPPAADDSMAITVTAGKGRLGVAVLQISPELRAYFGAPTDRGVLVDSVRADSPAAKAGLRAGDVIVSLDGTTTRAAPDLLDAMAERKKGDAVAIAIVRDRTRRELRATLEDDAAPPGRVGPRSNPRSRDWFRDMPAFDDGELQRQLDDARDRIEKLEQRLEKLEHTQRS